MTTPPLPLSIHVGRDLDDLSEWAAQRFIELAHRTIGEGQRFTVALAGGGTPKGLYERLGRPEHAGRIDWGRVLVFFSDERCVPPEDAASNYRMARQTLLNKVPIPDANIARMRGELDPAIAAAAYATEIERAFPGTAAAPGRWPHFDLVLLGMGPDGHTASLFPHTEALAEQKALVVANEVKKLNAFRLTFTRPLIGAARNVWVLCAGREKTAIVVKVLTGRHAVETYPVQTVFEAQGDVLWILDESSAAKLPAELRHGDV